jgi:hypothetical protein
VIPIGQRWNEAAEHMGRGWEAVQQQNVWQSVRAGFAIENFRAVDDGMVITSHSVSPQEIGAAGADLTPAFGDVVRAYIIRLTNR